MVEDARIDLALMSPDPNAEAEAASVVKKLQTGEYVFLDEQARRITDSEGRTLADRFHSSKQMYLTFPSLVKSELVVSLFLASVTEARIRGALIDTKSRSYLRIVDDETEKTVNELIDQINVLNTISKGRFGCPLFVNDAKLMLNLKHPVDNEPEYVFRIATIGCIIDYIYRKDITDRIQSLTSLPKSDGEIRSIMLVEALLKVDGVQFKEPIQMLRRLNTIRSKTSPIHRADHDLVKVYQHLGIKWPTQDLSTAGKTCLQYFLRAIESLRQRLSP